MQNIIIVAFLFMLATLFKKQIRKHFKVLLVLSIVLSTLAYVFNVELITEGFFGLAFFIIVMYGGALSKDSKARKTIMAIRKEYSIFGFVFVSSHAIFYLMEFLSGDRSLELLGLLPYLIMIPLTVISFTIIRKKMKPKTWEKVQKFSYLIYAITFIHLILVAEAAHVFVYILIFGSYTILKIKKEFFSKKEIK